MRNCLYTFHYCDTGVQQENHVHYNAWLGLIIIKNGRYNYIRVNII